MASTTESRDAAGAVEPPRGRGRGRPAVRALADVLLVAAAYFAAARLGLTLALPPGYASPIWPAAGLGLAAVVIGGPRLALGVAIGSGFANAIHPDSGAWDPTGLALGLAAGLEALAGALLVPLLSGRDRTLSTLRGVSGFSASAIVASLVGATVGVGILGLVGRVSGAAFATNWITWWIGDLVGAAIFGPLVLLYFGRPAAAFRPRRVTAGLPIIATFGVCALLQLFGSRTEERMLRAETRRLLDATSQQLQAVIERHTIALDALRGALGADPSPDHFQRLARELVAEVPGLLALEWAPRVPAAERPAFEQRATALFGKPVTIFERSPDGAFVPAGARPAYWPVFFIEPTETNVRALGFDLASEPMRREAIEATARTGMLAASDRVDLVQDASDHGNGLLVVLSDGAAGASRGVYLGVFDLVRMLDASLDKSLAGVRWSLRDLDEQRTSPPLGDLADLSHVVVPEIGPDETGISPHGSFARRELDVIDHRWELTLFVPMTVDGATRSRMSWFFLLATLLGSTIIGGLVLVVTGRTQAVEAEVRARTADLAMARDEALRASRAKSSFVATMSHEIRTPMTGVIGVASLLAETPLTPEQRGLVSTILRSGETLLVILNDVLDHSKIEAGRLELESVPVDLRAAAEEVLALHRPRAHDKGITLELDWPAGVWSWVRGDVVRLRQVLLNLLSNGVKFTDRGGVRVAARDTETHVIVSVTDTGIGIDDATLPLLFQPFSQGDASTTRRFGGTGLGLAIAHRLVAAMGGTLEVRSAPGTGSTFTVTVPRTAAPMPAPAPAVIAPQPAAAEETAPRSVLLVEDNHVAQQVIKAMLGKLGIEAELASDGAQAVEATARHHFDLVLLDMQMPVMDGPTAARTIRAAEAAGQPRTYILALTANASSDDRRTCLDAGMDGFLAKPLTLAALRKALEDAFAASR